MFITHNQVRYSNRSSGSDTDSLLSLTKMSVFCCSMLSQQWRHLLGWRVNDHTGDGEPFRSFVVQSGAMLMKKANVSCIILTPD